MVLQNYQNLIEMTSNIFHIVAFGVGFKCPRKIYLNTQWGEGAGLPLVSSILPSLLISARILDAESGLFLPGALATK